MYGCSGYCGRRILRPHLSPEYARREMCTLTRTHLPYLLSKFASHALYLPRPINPNRAGSMADTGGSASKMALPSGAAALRSVSSLGGLPAIVDDDTELVRINTLVPFHSFSAGRRKRKERKKEAATHLHSSPCHRVGDCTLDGHGLHSCRELCLVCRPVILMAPRHFVVSPLHFSSVLLSPPSPLPLYNPIQSPWFISGMAGVEINGTLVDLQSQGGWVRLFSKFPMQTHSGYFTST